MGLGKFVKKAVVGTVKVAGSVVLGATGVASSVVEYVGAGSGAEIIEGIGHGLKSASFNGVRKMWGSDPKEYDHSVGNAGRRRMDQLQKEQADVARKAGQKVDAYERKVQQAAEAGKISRAELAEKKKKIQEARERIEKKAGGVTGTETGKVGTFVNPKTVDEWDKEWVSIGMLKEANLTPYNHCVGLYRHVIGGTTKYVGRAIELNNGGFRKRLSDYRRDSDSARKHASGQTIHEHLDEIETFILVVGTTQEAVAVTRKLEGEFVRRYNPDWNKQINI